MQQFEWQAIRSSSFAYDGVNFEGCVTKVSTQCGACWAHEDARQGFPAKHGSGRVTHTYKLSAMS